MKQKQMILAGPDPDPVCVDVHGYPGYDQDVVGACKGLILLLKDLESVLIMSRLLRVYLNTISAASTVKTRIRAPWILVCSLWTGLACFGTQ